MAEAKEYQGLDILWVREMLSEWAKMKHLHVDDREYLKMEREFSRINNLHDADRNRRASPANPPLTCEGCIRATTGKWFASCWECGHCSRGQLFQDRYETYKSEKKDA